LFVGNLSWNIDDEWLYREFEEFGELTGARVVTDKATGRSKGFGYVEFGNATNAAAVSGREGHIYGRDGHSIVYPSATPAAAFVALRTRRIRNP